MVRIAVVEPWGGGSHAAWAEGLRRYSAHDVTVLALPDQAWRWRLRASAPWFAAQIAALRHAPDALLVSSLVDAAALRGLLGRDIPMALYAHESQWAYPGDGADIESATRNLVSMAAVDEVWFNSDFHRRVALDAAGELVGNMPEEQRVELELDGKSSTVYPGVELSWASPMSSTDGPPVIVWPHRWDHDKEPDTFERALERLVRSGQEFGLVLAGSDARPESRVRRRIVERFTGRLLAVGPFDLQTYRKWLHRSDLVVSCTAHEFFGMAVVEALAAGCRPVLPDAFSYPEIVAGTDVHRLYPPGRFGSALLEAVRRWPDAGPVVPVDRFDWSRRVGEFDRRLDELATRHAANH